MKSCKISGISGYNLGDQILSQCLTKLLLDKGIEHDNYHLEPLVEPIVRLKNKKISNKYSLLFNGLKKNKFLLYSFLLAKTLLNIPYYKRITKEYNCIYYGGGNLVSNSNGSNYLFILFIIALLSRKGQICVLFCGIGPFSFRYNWQLKYIIHKSRYIIVRDAYSRSLLPIKHNSQVIIDPAILCSTYYPISNICKKNQDNVILFNLMDFSDINSNLNMQLKIYTIVQNINTIADAKCCTPALFVTSDSDLDFNNRVSKEYSSRFDKNLAVHVPKKIEDIQDLFSNVRAAIVHRMHSGILTISYGIPTYMFPWQEKLIGFSERFYGVDINHHLLDDVAFNPNEVLVKMGASMYNDYQENLVSCKKEVIDVEI